MYEKHIEKAAYEKNAWMKNLITILKHRIKGNA